MRRAALPAFLLFALACTSVPTVQTQPGAPRFAPVAEDRARIYVARPGIKGIGEAVQVTVDGVVVGQLPAQAYLAFEVKPGKRTVTISVPDFVRSLEVEAAAGEMVYLKLDNLGRFRREHDQLLGRAAVTSSRRQVEALRTLL